MTHNVFPLIQGSFVNFARNSRRERKIEARMFEVRTRLCTGVQIDFIVLPGIRRHCFRTSYFDRTELLIKRFRSRVQKQIYFYAWKNREMEI